MAKARKQKGAISPPAGSRMRTRLIVVLAVAIVGLAAVWWFSTADDRAFSGLASAGEPALSKVVSEPNAGRQHIQAGATYRYPSRFPTSGPHDPNWVRSGFYTSPQAPTLVVHALEHGNIVIYYERPGEPALAQLMGWSERFRGQWDGVVVLPASGLGEAVVLTAWTKRLELERFDAAAAAAFIDAYRGRGPENRVR